MTKVAVWLLVAGIPAGLVYGALLGDLFRGAEPPRPMAGDFNIAIAEPQLLEGDDLARNEGVSLADSMHLRFSETFCGETNGTEIVDGFLFDCWSPEMIGAITGEDDAAREEEAAELARTIRADIVVYGTVTQRNGQLEFAPVVYIADRQLLRAEEFSGAHTLVSSSGNVALANQRRDLRASAERQASDISDLVFALSFYASGEFDEGLRRVDAAIAGSEWRTDRELLYLLKGNLEGKLGNIEEAEAAYTAAIDTRPGYARAHVGLGEVAYQRAIGPTGSCAAGAVTNEALDAAVTAYEAAIAAPIKPAAANVDTKATFGIARTEACRTQAGLDQNWATAEAQFRQVVQVYEDGAPGLAEIAAESYSFLAFITMATIGTAEDQSMAYRAAIDDLDRALALSAFADRDAQFFVSKAFAQEQLGETEAACLSLASITIDTGEEVLSSPLAQTATAAADRLGCP
ncbi:MAG: hypothetical protein AAGA65_28865 [Actinomycetota bacterium]